MKKQIFQQFSLEWGKKNQFFTDRDRERENLDP